MDFPPCYLSQTDRLAAHWRATCGCLKAQAEPRYTYSSSFPEQPLVSPQKNLEDQLNDRNTEQIIKHVYQLEFDQ